MMVLKMVLKIIYYIGIAACGIQGAEKSKKIYFNVLYILTCALLTAFSGGFTRDTAVLYTYPVVFTLECLPDITVALLSAITFHVHEYKRKQIMLFAIIADAVGLAQFITIGVDKAVDMGASDIIAFISGITTALGGSIVSSLFCGDSIKKILSSNLIYRIHTIIGAFIYISLLNNGVAQLTAQMTVVLYTGVFATSCNSIVRIATKKYISRTLRVLQQSNSRYSDIQQQMSEYCFKKPFFCQAQGFNTYKYFYCNLCFSNSKKVLMYHRIRQMYR